MLTTFALFLVLAVFFKIFQDVLVRGANKVAKKTKTDLDDVFLQIINSVKPQFYWFLSFYLALETVSLPHFFNRLLEIILLMWISYQAVYAFHILIDYVFKKFVRKESSSSTKEAIETISKILKGVLWVLGALFVLQNLGINVTSLMAGLGIGGVAVALAAQNILGDLFSSFAILFDKPFVPGDFIIVGEHMGIVEDIGIKTTRIRALQGEEVVISNQELTSTRIQNFKKLKERRVVFRFGVKYETANSKLEEIPADLKKIITSIKKCRFDRAHFIEFGDFALIYEVVYYVLSSDYNEYMDIHQKILLNVREKFGKKNIEMSYPTQTIYLHKD